MSSPLNRSLKRLNPKYLKQSLPNSTTRTHTITPTTSQLPLSQRNDAQHPPATLPSSSLTLVTKQLHTLRVNNQNEHHHHTLIHRTQHPINTLVPSELRYAPHRSFATSPTSENNNPTSSSSSVSSQSQSPHQPSSSVTSDSTYRTHYGTYNPKAGAQRQGPSSSGGSTRMRISRQLEQRGNDKYRRDEPLRPSQQSGDMDFNTLFDSTRHEYDEYMRRVDRDVDPTTGKRPTSIRSYIRTLEYENRVPVEDFNTDDYDNINEIDLEQTGISEKTSRKLLGKTFENRRLIKRLEREEILQDRLSMLDKYGEFPLLKPGDIWTTIPRINKDGRAMGLGRRKSSYAHVFVKPNKQGTGDILVNKERYSTYFNRITHRDIICRALHVTNTFGQWDIECRVWGGGHSGQADAIKLGLTRAINNYDPNYREILKDEFLFYRDPREVERKKFGKYKARKSFTFVKR